MSQNDNLFKKIMRGEIPSNKVYEDEFVFAFRDIAPVAPTHILVIPKAPIDSLDELSDGDAERVGHLLTAAARIARSEGIAEGGYRCVINTGAAAGQTVPHLHLHLIAGRDLQWPPG